LITAESKAGARLMMVCGTASGAATKPAEAAATTDKRAMMTFMMIDLCLDLEELDLLWILDNK